MSGEMLNRIFGVCHLGALCSHPVVVINTSVLYSGSPVEPYEMSVGKRFSMKFFAYKFVFGFCLKYL